MALSQEKIASLLAGKSGKSSKRGQYCTGKFGSESTILQGIVPASDAGSFVGKTSSVRRSSKGGIRKNLDGSRKYLDPADCVLWYVIRSS